MSFVQPEVNTTKRTVGIAVAVVFHILLIWGLMNGLASKVVHAIAKPIQTKIIQEVKPPPPPPKRIPLPPPPKFTPPPAFVPPPEVKVQVSAPVNATISATSHPVPVAPRPVLPTTANAAVVCSNYQSAMGNAAFPREAFRAGLSQGSALIEFTLGVHGEILNAHALRASDPVFATNSIRIVQQLKCAGQGRQVQVQVPFVYRSE